MVSMLTSGPNCPGFDHQLSPKISEEKLGNVAEVNQPHCIEESEQWLENVDQTHLELACGKLVPQKEFHLRILWNII